nr:MAG TPA: hypothetical protein [Caudoviricetes sp.]
MVLNMFINKIPGEFNPGIFLPNQIAIKSFHVAGPQIPSATRTPFLDA